MSDQNSSLLFSNDERPIRFLFENSAFLILGTILALVWVNSSEYGLKTHRYFFEQFELKHMFSPPSEEGAQEILEDFDTGGHPEGHADNDIQSGPAAGHAGKTDHPDGENRHPGSEATES